jgi:hemolysin III
MATIVSPAATAHEPRYAPGEEIASSLIHGVGIVLSIAGLAVLCVAASRRGDAWCIASCAIYATSLILLYTASTLYHGIPHGRAKAVLRTLDHAAIFLLIAGTYTPFTLVSLRGPWGYALCAIVWTLAAVGIALELAGVRVRALRVGLYIGMGWIGLIAIRPLIASIAPGGLWLLFGGGVCYTLGVAFYVSRRLPYSHAIWHAFVLAGSVMQYFAVLFHVLPPGRFA